MSHSSPRPAPRTLILILLVLTVLSWAAAIAVDAWAVNLGDPSLVFDADYVWMRLSPWLPLAGVHAMAFVGVYRAAPWARLLPVCLGAAGLATVAVQGEPGVGVLAILVSVAAVPLTAAGFLYARRTEGPFDLAGAVAPLIALFPSLVFAGTYLPPWFPPPGTTFFGCLLGAITAGLAATTNRVCRVLLVVVVATPLAASGFVLTMNHVVPRMFKSGDLAGHAVMIIASLTAIVGIVRRPVPVASRRRTLLIASLLLATTSAQVVALSPHVRPTPGQVDAVCPQPDGTIDVYYRAPTAFVRDRRYRRDRRTGAANIHNISESLSTKPNPEFITRLRYDENLGRVSRQRVEATPEGMFCDEGDQTDDSVEFFRDSLFLDGPNRSATAVPLPGNLNRVTWGADLPRYVPVSLNLNRRAPKQTILAFAIVDTRAGRATQLCESQCEYPSRPYCRYGFCMFHSCQHGITIMDGSTGRPVVSIDSFGALRPGGVSTRFGSGIVDLDFETQAIRTTTSNRTLASATGHLAPVWRHGWTELDCQPLSANPP